MATLRANGETLVELVATKTDVEDESGTHTDYETRYRAMSNGYVLKRHAARHYIDGMRMRPYNSGWKRLGKIKASMKGDHNALRVGMQQWADQLTSKGYQVTIG